MPPKRSRSSEENEMNTTAKKQPPLEDVPSTPDRYPDPSCFGEIIQVVLSDGSKKETHGIHKGLLCFYSEYFRDALDKQLQERRRQRRIELENLDLGIFAIFKGWLYARVIRGRDGLTESKNMVIEDLVGAWILGDRLIVPLFKNMILNEISHPIPSSDASVVHYIYDNTTRQSGLRRKYMAARLCYILEKEGRLDEIESQEDWPMDAV